MSVYLTLNSDSEIEGESSTMSVATPLSEASQALVHFWPTISEEIKAIEFLDIRCQALPLARIKKIMKLDEDVKMISAEAPVLFAKAAEIFIKELTLRSWVHTEDNKRRTLQRNDIAMAITKYDQFDFLIDIVPRDEAKPHQSQGPSQPQSHHSGSGQQSLSQSSSSQQRTAGGNMDQLHYYFQFSQQGQGGSQLIQQTIPVQQEDSKPISSAAPQTNIQLVQQVVGANGEIQQIPIQLSPAQMQMIRMQLQANPSGQPLLIQAAASPTSTTQQANIVQTGQQQQQATSTSSSAASSGQVFIQTSPGQET